MRNAIMTNFKKSFDNKLTMTNGLFVSEIFPRGRFGQHNRMRSGQRFLRVPLQERETKYGEQGLIGEDNMVFLESGIAIDDEKRSKGRNTHQTDMDWEISIFVYLVASKYFSIRR